MFKSTIDPVEKVLKDSKIAKDKVIYSVVKYDANKYSNGTTG